MIIIGFRHKKSPVFYSFKGRETPCLHAEVFLLGVSRNTDILPVLVKRTPKCVSARRRGTTFIIHRIGGSLISESCNGHSRPVLPALRNFGSGEVSSGSSPGDISSEVKRFCISLVYCNVKSLIVK
ncbi:hypothetical protein COS81_03520 [candidate division WWE3 bacterium CG06_land_8_20_14_3_00_42_16]|uniref:Uncharacterized protein n=1 Tax=candidate division WWE3 bacterium CG06_land_8_20_14_3_00_42_16 TaxID=1975083 RepID=A0A2M7AMG5_UNCKA|nr:MAG: hypothetical protein COS81_03520 [candidate division WWE3 bacterium CG06_land_8_20_14_3_00_42_16]